MPFPETSSVSGPVEVGGAGRTVTRKVVEDVALPSLRYRVTSEVPAFPDAGVSVTVRRLPSPPKAMLLVGVKAGLVELAQSFKLSAAGEELFLIDTDARQNAILDSVTFGPQEADRAWGRTAADPAVFGRLDPSPGRANP